MHAPRVVVVALTCRGLSNFGVDVGRYSGAALIEALGVHRPHYDGITSFMAIKTCFRLLPLLTVPLLVPQGTPADTAEQIGAGDGVVGLKLIQEPEPLEMEVRNGAHGRARTGDCSPACGSESPGLMPTEVDRA